MNDTSERLDLYATFGASISSDQKAFNIGIEKQFNNGLLAQLRYAGIHDLVLMPDNEPQEFSTDYGALIGKRFYVDDRDQQTDNSISLLVGIGKVDVVERGEFLSGAGENIIGSNQFERISNTAVGIPFEFSYSNRSSSVGFKVGFHGNINKYNIFLGFALGFTLNLI